MSYESRLYVCARHIDEDDNRGWTEFLAMFEMSCIDQCLVDLFDKPYDNADKFADTKSELFIGNGFEVIKTDCYGCVPTECGFDRFLNALVSAEHNQHWRRYAPLIAYLNALRLESWDATFFKTELIIIHTGY